MVAQLKCTWRIRIAYDHKEIVKGNESAESAKSANY